MGVIMLGERESGMCLLNYSAIQISGSEVQKHPYTGTSVSNLKMREHQFLENKEMKSVISITDSESCCTGSL